MKARPAICGTTITRDHEQEAERIYKELEEKGYSREDIEHILIYLELLAL